MSQRGFLRLWVKRDGKPWGLLETVDYDDNQKRRTRHRKHMLAEMQMSLTNWSYNYHLYRDAKFCIEEEEIGGGYTRLVFGVPRDREYHRGSRTPRLIPKSKQSAVRKTAQSKGS